MAKIVCLLFSLCLIACAPKEPIYTSKSYVFGTLVEISIYGGRESEAQLASSLVMQELQSLHNRLHAWQPSEINGINHKFQNNQLSLQIKPDLADMLARIQTHAQQTDNLFNPTIGSLIALWGFQSDTINAKQIDAQTLAQLVAQKPSLSDISLSQNTITTANNAVRLDLGGVAKGIALDKAQAILRQQHLENALINIGGNILAMGQKGNAPWHVGIQHPRQPNAIASLALPAGWAIGTSGDYQRFFMLGGKRFCHIIDPRTGYPADRMQAVTVLIPPGEDAGLMSDLASKPLFIDGAEYAPLHAKHLNIANYLLIDAQGTISVSAAMQKRLQWLNGIDPRKIKLIP